MTQDEAQKKANKINDTAKAQGPTWFCPVINDRCKPSCVFYESAYAFKHQDTYHVSNNYCQLNAAISKLI